MHAINPEIRPQMQHCRAFTLVEMLVVIAILMTAGASGLGRLGGKGVTSGVAAAEALFDEARNIAIGRNLRSCVLVAKTLKNNPAEDLRRVLVAYEEVDLPVGGSGAKSFRFLGTGILTDYSRPDKDLVSSGRFMGMVISTTVLTDFVMDQIRSGRRTFNTDQAKSEFLAKYSYNFTKNVQLSTL